MPTEIAAKITPVPPEEAARAISVGYQKVTGKKPSANVLSLLLGQWALETGNGDRVWNYNFGNKKATASDEYHQFFRCSEVVNGQTVYYDPPNPACKFAAYKDAASGAAAFVRSLKSRDHWWKGLHSGSAEGFVQGLITRPAYFTANPAEYLRGLSNRAASYAPYAKKYAGSAVFQVIVGMLATAGLYLVFREVEKRYVSS